MKTPKTHASSPYRSDWTACGRVLDTGVAMVTSPEATCKSCRNAYGEQDLAEAFLACEECGAAAPVSPDGRVRLCRACRAQVAADLSSAPKPDGFESLTRDAHARLTAYGHTPGAIAAAIIAECAKPAETIGCADCGAPVLASGPGECEDPEACKDRRIEKAHAEQEGAIEPDPWLTSSGVPEVTGDRPAPIGLAEASVTRDDIERLKVEAGAAGDAAQVAMCDRALAGRLDAWTGAARVIVCTRAEAALSELIEAEEDFASASCSDARGARMRIETAVAAGKAALERARGLHAKAHEPARCYSDHDEDIRTKGSCDYCRGTKAEARP